jgi:hypothetical protein
VTRYGSFLSSEEYDPADFFEFFAGQVLPRGREN